MPEEDIAEGAVEDAHIEHAEEPVVEEAPTEEAPTEEPVKVPNIFVHEAEPYTGTLTGPRVLVVIDEGKAYPMDESANAFVRANNIPILAKMPEGVTVEGSVTYADLSELAKRV